MPTASAIPIDSLKLLVQLVEVVCWCSRNQFFELLPSIVMRMVT